VLAATCVGAASWAPVRDRTLARIGPYGPIFNRLPGEPSDPPRPAFPGVDVGALRRAADILPRGARYLLYHVTLDRQVVQPLGLAAGLYLADCLRVRRAAEADWVLRYGARGLPAGVRPLRSHELGRGVALVRVRRA
jgi:hypothetical protein